MREIKFKAWAWDTRHPDYKKKKYLLDVLQIDFEKRTVVLPYKIDKAREENFDNIELMQFTGLKDKNGKEIYESDVVRILYTGWRSKDDNDKRTLEQYKKDISSIGVVEFELYKYIIKFNEGVYDNIIPGNHGELEAIGNIYENPELLK